MTAPAVPRPPKLAPVIPGECEALRDGTKCRDAARLYACGYRCGRCRPGATPAPIAS